MSTLPIVYRGYVNPWDCDEMGHMNVQFYVAKASEGLDGLLSQLGADAETRAKARVTAHRIRFLKEMHVSDLVLIHGGATRSAHGVVEAVLEIRNERGDVCNFINATVSAGVKGHVLYTEMDRPGGMEAGAEGDGTLAAATGFCETIRNTVQLAHCDPDGRLAPRGVMARFSEAQGHLWSMLEAPRAWQRESGLATATLEYRIRYGAKPKAGALVRLMTAVVAASSRTVRFRHWLFDAETDDMVAAAAGAALFLDKTTRKPVALPENVANAAARLIG